MLDRVHPDADRSTDDVPGRETSAVVSGPSAGGRPAAGSSIAFPRPRWETRFAAAVVVVDVVAILATVALGHVLGLGDQSDVLGTISPGLGLASGTLTVACLYLTGAWDARVLGQGAEEFSRLLRAFVTSAVVLGLGGLALQLPAVRPWVFGLIPLGGALAAASRMVLRKPLHHARDRGRCVHRALVVGCHESVVELVERTRRDPHNGWQVTAVCTPTGAGPDGADHILGVPVVGDLDSVVGMVRAGQHRVVAVARTPGWSPRRLHQLAWDLEDLGADLVVDPGLMEVAGPRLHIAPVDDLPLLRLTRPTLSGVPRVIKYALDRIGGVALLVLLAPVLLAIVVAVRSDGGPALFRQTRVGRGGQTFTMIKFRSMVVGAEQLRAALEGTDEGAGPLFKMHADPRVTRVGAWLRKYSLDELPQLLNVVTGSMSLVGPRPPLPFEVATYAPDARRKLLVRPGLTGLWQVSGRSNLSWDESVRLDLRYVENWSLALDALILWKTVGAVVRCRGAY